MATTNANDLYDPQLEDRKSTINRSTQENSSPDPTVTGEEQQAAKLALERLQQYIQTALAETDAETAMLGVCNGSLMQMLLHLNEAIASVLAERPSGSEHFQILARGIEITLRLTTQVSRFTQLRLVLKEASQATARLGDD
jgi:hypothetical protein